MQKNVLDGALWVRMMMRGAAVLDKHRVEVNGLNVFPIPDGDTGDNMLMTLQNGCKEVTGLPGDAELCDVARAASSGMLLGARGNSGVILSRIFAGIAKGLENLPEADPSQFPNALRCGVAEAYAAVANPVEGTILTVFKDASKAACGDSLETVLDSFLKEASASLARTPELLAVLKEAGVVDSGGAGLIYIFEGMRDALDDDGPEVSLTYAGTRSGQDGYDAFGPDNVLEFGYCTEFLLRLQSSKVSLDTFDSNEIKDYLLSVGESVVCFREGSIVKVHVHSFTPGEILSHCQRWGEFLSVKVENMTLQHNGIARGEKTVGLPRRRYAAVAVVSGDGLIQAFRECGVEEIIEGGQTMNPSASDFIAAFKRADADTVFVFPNNSNIILAAQQAAEMYKDSEVIVFPSKSIGAGYVAAASLDRNIKDSKEIYKSVMDTLESVTCCQVSRAIRNSNLDGLDIKSGDYIGIEGHRIICAGSIRQDVALELADKLGMANHDVAVIFYGADSSAEEAGKLVSEMQGRFPRTEIILSKGSQPIFDYIIALC